MSTTTAGIIFLALLILALAAVHVPLGDYMYRVYTGTKDSRAERLIYRAIGADPKSEQTWGGYARSVLAFSAISILRSAGVMAILRWFLGLAAGYRFARGPERAGRST